MQFCISIWFMLEASSEPSHTSKSELFAQTVNVLKLLTIFAKKLRLLVIKI